MTLNELTTEKIRFPQTFQEIKKLGDSYVLYFQAKEAYFLQEKITSLINLSNLQNFNPELYKNYQNLLISLKWTAFPLLPEEEVLTLLRNNYVSVLDNELIDVADGIEAKMFTLGLFLRDDLRQKMHKALNENKEYLGEKTFGEWLMDYSRAFDLREHDEMTPLNYFNQSPEAQTLSGPDKNKLRKALQIFDQTLLVTPIMTEPLLSMAMMAMINNGTIDKKSIDPVLLQTIYTTVRNAGGTTIRPLPKVETKILEPIKPTPPLPKPEPREIKSFPPEQETKFVKDYQIRTMQQDLKQTGRQPIPPKPQIKKDNIVDLSGK